jgi:predicted house-cleaning noncanonical NTP pyrophosphatase (MazG superfamily)
VSGDRCVQQWQGNVQERLCESPLATALFADQYGAECSPKKVFDNVFKTKLLDKLDENFEETTTRLTMMDRLCRLLERIANLCHGDCFVDPGSMTANLFAQDVKKSDHEFMCVALGTKGNIFGEGRKTT